MHCPCIAGLLLKLSAPKCNCVVYLFVVSATCPILWSMVRLTANLKVWNESIRTFRFHSFSSQLSPWRRSRLVHVHGLTSCSSVPCASSVGDPHPCRLGLTEPSRREELASDDLHPVRLDLSAESAAIQQCFCLTTNQRTVLSAQ
jgi:hypothetical protein